MYTFQQITAKEFLGFNNISLLLLCLLLCLITVKILDLLLTDKLVKEFTALLIKISALTTLSSATTYLYIESLVVYQNKEVAAELLTTGSATESYGKYNRQIQAVGMVQYLVPEGIVTFKTKDGVAYPAKVVLYKN